MSKTVRDTNTSITQLRNKLRQFSEDRNWVQRYSESSLAKSIVLEAAELLEHFQWNDNHDYNRTEVAFELVDILYYALMLAEIMDIDIMEYTDLKLKDLEVRYPSKKV